MIQGSKLYESRDLQAFCSFPYRICTWIPCLINQSPLKHFYLLVLPCFLSSCKNICICIFLYLGFVCAQISSVERLAWSWWDRALFPYPASHTFFSLSIDPLLHIGLGPKEPFKKWPHTNLR